MAEIVLDSLSLERASNGTITGRIFVRGVTGNFPSEHWTDLPAVALRWWIDGLRAVVSGHASMFDGLFMNGPFSFSLRLSEDNTQELVFLTRDECVRSEPVEVEELLRSAIMAAMQLMVTCRRQGWNTRDVEGLYEELGRPG